MAIEEEIVSVVSDMLNVKREKITRDSRFKEDLEADSLDTVELIMAFESKYRLIIPDSEAQKIDTVGKAIDYVAANYKPS